MYNNSYCSCDPYVRCSHRPFGWVPPPSPGYHHAGPPPAPSGHYQPPSHQYVPPPPGPGQVIPDWALPQCGHSSHYHGCNHCTGWQWR